MLTGKQKRYLRSEAHHLKAIFQVGKEGVSANQIKGIDDALEAQELIKVKLLNSDKFMCLQTKPPMRMLEDVTDDLLRILA